MIRREDSIEIPYGWVVVFVSLALHTIALGAPNILFVALKPIAADLDLFAPCLPLLIRC